MKEVDIKIAVDNVEGKIAYAIQTGDYDNKNISHQLELLGMMESLKDIIKDRIDTLLNIRK